MSENKEIKNKIPAVDMAIVRRAGSTNFRIKSQRIEDIMRTLSRGVPARTTNVGSNQYAIYPVGSDAYQSVINYKPTPDKSGAAAAGNKDIALQFMGLNHPIVTNDGTSRWSVNLSWLTFAGIGVGQEIKIEHPFTKVQIDQMAEVLKIALKRFMEDLGKEWQVSVTLYEKGDAQVTDTPPGA